MLTVQSQDGTTIAYDTLGSGPALIYITGAICHRNFQPIRDDVKAFASAFTVYNYDRRGRGDSTDTQPYSIEKEVEDLEALIDAAGGKAFLYGHSSGAALALEAALRLGKKVKKVALYDAPYVESKEAKKKYELVNQEVEQLLQQGKNKQALFRFLSGIGMPKVFIYLLPFMPGWGSMLKLAPTLMYDIELTKDLPPLKRAGKVTTPVLVLSGEKSPPELRVVADQLAAAIPQAQRISVPRQNHMVSAKALMPLFTEFFLK